MAEDDKDKPQVTQSSNSDEISPLDIRSIKEHQSPHEKPLRLSDVKAMFLQMRDQG
jgi:hypothetical protein